MFSLICVWINRWVNNREDGDLRHHRGHCDVNVMITRKLLSLSLDLLFKILLFQVAFPIFFSVAIFSPFFLLVALLLPYVALFQTRELVNYQRNCKLMKSGRLQWQVSLMGALTFLIPFRLQLTVACRLCVIYMRKIMIPMYMLWLHGLYGLHGPRWLLSEKFVKLNHSLALCQSIHWRRRHNLTPGNNSYPWFVIGAVVDSAITLLVAIAVT